MYTIKNSKNKLKRIVSVFSICIIACLCGCTSHVLEEDTSITPQTYSEVEYTGLWTHTEYPDAYSVVIFEQQGDEISFEVTAIRGNGSQIATSKMTNVQLVDGKGEFKFVDSFENAGTGEIYISGGELVLKYNTDEPYKGNWCIDAGEGSYVKSKKLSEIDYTNEQKSYENITIDHSGFIGTWYFTNYSDPSYDDFKPIEIREYGENQAVIDWGDGRTDIIEFISENEAKGAYLGIEDAKYYVQIDNDGYESFNVEPIPGGQIFQPGAGGYRTVPEYFKK